MLSVDVKTLVYLLAGLGLTSGVCVCVCVCMCACVCFACLFGGGGGGGTAVLDNVSTQAIKYCHELKTVKLKTLQSCNEQITHPISCLLGSPNKNKDQTISGVNTNLPTVLL